MHGVTREILNLVRASKQVRDKTTAPPLQQETSQQVYADLLEALSSHVQLRVVVDVIAGASAGGINGIMLSRALAYDLPLDSHRKMWLELADVTELLDPKGRASLWSKPFMRPMLAFLGWWQSKNLSQISSDAARSLEVRQKLSLFTRSRWFQPPFSGQRMTRMMLDGLRSIGMEEHSSGSLLPNGHPLDLFVTSTDFWGHRQLITLHDPPVIVEREHRHIFTFRHLQRGDDTHDDEHQMSDLDIPGLAFAARATSCFPGAFPPAQLQEVDGVLKQMGLRWEDRDGFINRSFKPQLAEGEDIEDAAFIDGSVLMNKPLDLAIRAVQNRSANREVDRRIVYIDPNPDRRQKKKTGRPGFFGTLKGALSDIPRNQPIRDDLEWLNDFNQRSENYKQIVTALTPRVTQAVTKIRSSLWRRNLTTDKLAQWRMRANSAAAENAGFAYGGYARLKVLTVLEEVAETLNSSAGLSQVSLIRTELDQWAYRLGILPIKDAALEAQSDKEIAWVNCLRTFDARFRVRRVRFMLRRVNELYRAIGLERDTDREWLNRTKKALYENIDTIERASKLSGVEAIEAVFFPKSALPETEAIDALMLDVGQALNLQDMDDIFELVLVDLFNDCPNPDMAGQLLDCYLGFSFFDVATLPLTQWRDLYELDEVRVDRISANDANSLDKGGAGQLLKGAEMGNFGAFFSRAYRENDYLWGRLTGAERLIDLVLSAVPDHGLDQDIMQFKQRAFEAILQEEKAYLKQIPDIMNDIKKRIRAMN
jgi:patatin-related protein